MSKYIIHTLTIQKTLFERFGSPLVAVKTRILHSFFLFFLFVLYPLSKDCSLVKLLHSRYFEGKLFFNSISPFFSKGVMELQLLELLLEIFYFYYIVIIKQNSIFLNKLKSKAGSVDSIHSYILKLSAIYLAPILSRIINDSGI